MNAEDKIFLKNFYLNDCKKLEKLLNRKLPWNFSND